MINVDKWKEVGKEDHLSVINRIKKLRRLKNAVILAHYYQDGEIQEIADFVGDSLALAQQAEKTSSDIIVFAGVHFMAETAKIVNPKKKVLLPDINAGCSLANSCTADELRKFKHQYPGYTVVSYVNTSAEIKAMTDIICTSSNAVQIIQSLPKDEKILFAPDRNLGNYIKGISGREMVIFDGACHVHEEFSLARILEIKKMHPDAKLISHPECKKPILLISDFIGSTSALLAYTKNDTGKKFIVATEPGILYQMKKASKNKEFIQAPPDDPTCACSECQFMKLITIEKIARCLENEKPEIVIDKQIIERAGKPIRRMLEISSMLGL